jgi:hypothetical protein
MPLDFVMLGSNGAPEKTIPLEVNLRHELLIVATACGLPCSQEFADYYADVVVAVRDLSALAERLKYCALKLQPFLDSLAELIAQCAAHGKALHALAD